MLRLVELHVRKYRDLVDGGPLRFGPGPVFLLGPNGSGKTTLLELIGMILRDDLSPLFKEDGAVELSWVLEAEGEGVTTRVEMSLEIEKMTQRESDVYTTTRPWKGSGVLHARRETEQDIRFTSSNDEGHYYFWEPSTEFAAGSPNFVGGANRAGWRRILASDIELFDQAYPDGSFGNGRVLTTSTGHWDRINPVRADEALTCYGHIAEEQVGTIALEEKYGEFTSSHDIPQWVPLPNALATQTEDHPDIALLTRLLGAERVEFRPRLISEDGRGRRRWRGFDIYVYWGGGALHHHSELSFGQKRLIALIWRMGVGVNLPLLTDEMTNGLHAGWVQAIIDHLGPRQGFHAVQNPLLIDRYGPGESAADVAGRFVICIVETGETGRQWRWRSPTAEECERLWGRFSTHYQPLSDVLISEGLW